MSWLAKVTVIFFPREKKFKCNAVKYYPTTFGSQGGVETTLEGAVINTEGEVIPGLYAVGEMSNRYYYNENYVLAASLGIYATAGNLCGTAAGTYAIG